MIKAILIDDEPLALRNLATLLKPFASVLQIVAETTSLVTAEDLICSHNPDVIFLDIDFGGQTSFSLLDKFPNRNFEIILVTAYDDFGIKALKEGVLDYLLKPIVKTELFKAVQKLQQKIAAHPNINTAETFKKPHKPARLALPTSDGLIFADYTSIIYCESEGRYTRFFLMEDNQIRKIIVAKNIGEYEEILPASSFIRVHHHYIVNIQYVVRYVRGAGGILIMLNGAELPVSKRKKEDFFRRLDLK